MGLETRDVLGVNVNISQRHHILEEVQKYLLQIPNPKSQIPKNGIKPFIIFTPNPEIINYAQKDDKFKEIVNSSQINIPDGMGVCWAISLLYGLKVKRLSGVDLMLDLSKIAYEKGFTIGLIGGRGKVAVEARECLLKKYLKLKVEVFEAPKVELSKIKDNTSFKVIGQKDKYFSSLSDEIIKRRINILFVALGFPKQEFFINLTNQQLVINNYQLPIVLMAVGGAFDYIAGRVTRAPQWIRNAGFEWLYRLIREPWRLPRQIRGVEFFYRVITSS